MAQLEEEKLEYMKNMSGEELSQQAVKYINLTIDLLRDCDSNHFLKSCFVSRFEQAKKIQIMLETRQYGALLMRAFQYISDLVVNFNAELPSLKNTLSSQLSNAFFLYLVDIPNRFGVLSLVY